MFCDFCKSTAVVCGFDGPETAVIMARGQETATWHNTGGWAACEPCAQLLEAGKLDELTNRSLNSKDNGWSDGMSDKVREMLGALLKDQYTKISRKREAA